ncbi:MAG: hypothetical protein H0X42_07115 [Solirubrobacterales bacterium]|nr:hypothetical protein [Solirubrobacterales bacterium]
MTRNLKVLGLALAAMFALTAVAASAAQAVTPEYHCTSTSANCFAESSASPELTGNGKINGSNDHVFNVNGGNVKCTGTTGVTDGAVLKGTAAKTSTSVTLTPTYAGCKAFGVKATVNPEGCTYTLTLVTGGISPYPITTDIKCPAGKKITVTPTGLSCTITVGEQTGLKGITATNVGTEPTHIEANINITGANGKIAYTKTGTECPEGPGSGTNGTYTGHSTITGFEDNSGTKGAKVGLHVF